MDDEKDKQIGQADPKTDLEAVGGVEGITTGGVVPEAAHPLFAVICRERERTLPAGQIPEDER